jgi:hypothetical protein
MTITDVPEHIAAPDEAQLLFEEARQRRRRRRLIGGLVGAALVLVIAVVVVAAHGASAAHEPVASAPPAPPHGAGAGAAVSFEVRQVLCYAPPFALLTGRPPSTGALPACSPATVLTASNLQVAPGQGAGAYTTRQGDIAPDPQFASFPSTVDSSARQGQTVLLSGTPSPGQGRFVLGPVGLDRSGIAHARATEEYGQWTIDLTLTPRGSVQWDALAHRTFHEILGMVVNNEVISVPIMQPTQSAFASFGGHLQISGTFTEQQAKALASGL